MTSSYKLAILLSSERKIYMVTNMLIKTRSIFNYLKLIFHVFVLFCFVLFCFVRIQWWPRWNPQRVYLFSQQFWRAGTVCEQGKKRKYKNGHLQEFSYWTSVWSGPFNFFDAASARQSFTDLGNYYSVPALVTDKLAILNGHKGIFSPDEVEVFYLDLSR